MLYAYDNGGKKCARVSEAFTAGAGGKVIHASRGIQPGAVALYGLLRGLAPIWYAAKQHRRAWYYLDNAYFGRDRYFRVTRGAMQWQGIGATPVGSKRLTDLALPWADWRRGGGHILIVQQSPAWYEFVGHRSREAWTQRTIAAIERHTDRPIRIRPKDTHRALVDDLFDCWATVTHSSNVAIDGLIQGVPAFVAANSSAAAPGFWTDGQAPALTDLSQIEKPERRADRWRWACYVAAQQWTLDEMRAGDCWRALQSEATQ